MQLYVLNKLYDYSRVMSQVITCTMGDHEWPVIGSKRDNDDMPECIREQLSEYWDHMVDSGLGWQSLKGNHAAVKRCVKALIDADMEWMSEFVGREEILFFRDVAFKDLSVDTVRWYVLLYGRFLKLMADNDIVASMDLHWPKAAVRPRVDWLNGEQVQMLLALELDVPERTALILMLCMGLRRIEVLRLKMEHIMDDGIMVRGKGSGGGKYRFVPYVPGAKEQLQAMATYREELIRRGRVANRDYKAPTNLFLTRNSLTPGAYSEAGTGFDRYVLYPIREASGIEFGNHTLRRTFARTLYNSGMKIEIISNLLGHADTKTTLTYIGIDAEQKINALGNFDWSKVN